MCVYMDTGILLLHLANRRTLLLSTSFLPVEIYRMCLITRKYSITTPFDIFLKNNIKAAYIPPVYRSDYKKLIEKFYVDLAWL